MKTTVELDDDLVIEAKKFAAERRTTLRKLIAQGLRQQVAAIDQPKRKGKIAWVTASGGLPRDLDVRDRERMHDWISRKR